jgi:hypothetical protein
MTSTYNHRECTKNHCVHGRDDKCVYPGWEGREENPVLTPSEDLMLEALLGRYRTGETLWTFESRHKRTAESLQAKGLVNLMHGIVEKSIRVSLTELGVKRFVSPD